MPWRAIGYEGIENCVHSGWVFVCLGVNENREIVGREVYEWVEESGRRAGRIDGGSGGGCGGCGCGGGGGGGGGGPALEGARPGGRRDTTLLTLGE